jgi:hypothetical protein
MLSSASLLRTALGLLVVLLVSACASSPSSPSSGSGVFGAPAPNAGTGDPNAAPRAPTPGTAPANPLATEQRFLEGWFGGTSVVIAAQPPVTLQLDVPLDKSFDTGKADVKPALGAVLDRGSAEPAAPKRGAHPHQCAGRCRWQQRFGAVAGAARA